MLHDFLLVGKHSKRNDYCPCVSTESEKCLTLGSLCVMSGNASNLNYNNTIPNYVQLFSHNRGEQICERKY